MDITDYKILDILQKDGRVSMKNLGEEVGLTSPAVSERVKRLEESGIIKGYKAIVDPDKVDKSIKAFVSVSIPSHNYKKFMAHAPENSNIVEAHHVTGGDSIILKVLVENMAELEEVIDDLKAYGDTQTNLILSSPIENKPII
jgi:Lrp/AsnC family leucine-responsive transcriptional regulator